MKTRKNKRRGAIADRIATVARYGLRRDGGVRLYRARTPRSAPFVVRQNWTRGQGSPRIATFRVRYRRVISNQYGMRRRTILKCTAIRITGGPYPDTQGMNYRVLCLSDTSTNYYVSGPKSESGWSRSIERLYMSSRPASVVGTKNVLSPNTTPSRWLPRASAADPLPRRC